MSTIRDVKLVDLPKYADRRGNLSFVEGNHHIPFRIQASHWIYDVPPGEIRGRRAYRVLQEFFVALVGSYDVVVDDGQTTATFTLNRSDVGIYVPSMIWSRLENFAPNSVCLVLASTAYVPEDYVTDYRQFLQEKAGEPS